MELALEIRLDSSVSQVLGGVCLVAAETQLYTMNICTALIIEQLQVCKPIQPNTHKEITSVAGPLSGS